MVEAWWHPLALPRPIAHTASPSLPTPSAPVVRPSLPFAATFKEREMPAHRSLHRFLGHSLWAALALWGSVALAGRAQAGDDTAAVVGTPTLVSIEPSAP